MEYYQLVYFEEVYRTRCFSSAAVNLGITHQALSASISKLEREIQGKLFQRNTKTVLPTELAEVVHVYGQRVLFANKELLQAIHDEKNHFESIQLYLSMGIPNGIVSYDLMNEFEKEHPNLVVNMDEMFSSECLEHLQSDNTLAVVMGYPGTAFCSQKLRHVKFQALVGKNSPLAKKKSLCLQDLSHETFLLPSENDYLSKKVNQVYTERGVEISIIYKRGHVQMLVNDVKLGRGIGLIIDYLIDKVKDDDVLIKPIVESDFDDDLYLAYHSQICLTQNTQYLWDYLIQNV